MMRRLKRVARRLWPLEPWRFVLVAVAIGLAIPLGIMAAAPVVVGGVELQVWNGADLGLLICLVIFASAFVIRVGEES